MIVFIDGKEIRFTNASRALNVARQNGTVVFGLGRTVEQQDAPEFVRAIYNKMEVKK